MLATLYNRILIVLAFAGIFVAGSLSAGEFYQRDLPCGPSHGCAIVAHHPSSHLLGGVANAYLGFAAYLLLATLAVTREILGVRKTPELTTVGTILSSLGSLFSLYLTFIAIVAIKATCIWCLSSLAIILATTVIHVLLLRLLASPGDELVKRGQTGYILIAASAVLAFGGVTFQALELEHEKGGVSTPTGFTAQDLGALTSASSHDKYPDGKLVVVEFGDLVCPLCKRAYPLLDDFIAKSGGKIRYVFHHFPLFTTKGHEFALPAAEISELCAEKGKFWEFVTDCYSGDAQAPEPTLDDMLAYAEKCGVNPETAKKRIQDTEDPAFKRVQNDLNIGNAFGVHSTPTFLIIAPGEAPVAVVGVQVIDILKDPKYKQYRS